MSKRKEVLRVPVSVRAITQRINRRLPEYHKLKKYRGGQWASNLGGYYVVDESQNVIVSTHVDLEELAKELDAIALYEHLEDDSQFKK